MTGPGLAAAPEFLRSGGDGAPSVALVGAGPRGALILERLVAGLDTAYPAGPLDVHVIDPHRPGAGRVWTRDQSYELYMNTVAGEVTLFPHAGSACLGPVVQGPSLYQWCKLAAGSPSRVEIPAAVRATFAQHPVDADVLGDETLMTDFRAMLPWSHPRRALFGVYLSWCFDRAVATAPDRLRVIRHVTEVDAVREEAPGAFRLDLADGTRVDADAVVFSLGWMAAAHSPGALDLAAAMDRNGLIWIPPASPREQDLSAIPAGASVLVRGLGMGFFDAMALLTIDRGGRFEHVDGSGRLRYVASGREPVLHVSSRRGVPFRSKTLYGSLAPASAQRFLLGAGLLEGEGPVDFGRDMMPLVLKDAVDAYYTTLRRTDPDAFAVPEAEWEAALADADVRAAEWSAFVERAVPDAARRLRLGDLVDPGAEEPGDAAAFTGWVAEFLRQDLAEGARGHASAFKAAAWSISSARGVVARIVRAGRLDGRSHGTDYLEFQGIGGSLGSGPPAFRSQQLLALVEAGLVDFVGPDLRIEVDDEAGVLVGTSPTLAEARVEGAVLLDAWMQMPAAGRTTEPVLRSLLDSGLARVYEAPAAEGAPFATGSIDIDRVSSRLVDATGSADRALYLLGIPAEDVRAGSIQSPLPRPDSSFVLDADRVAVELAGVASAVAAVRAASPAGGAALGGVAALGGAAAPAPTRTASAPSAPAERTRP